MTKKHLTLRLLALMAAAGPATYLAAQEPPATASTPAASDEIVTLEKLDVNEVPIEQNIMPTSRPFSSVYGTDQNITDIPRNVTIISREQLSAIAIQDVRDFSKLTSSSYTRTNFGAVGNPDIRGSSADVMQNGMRERYTSNGNGMPIDFNTIESVNIVKGPATVIQGASSYVGGYVDLITKRPTFDAPHGSASVTAGSDSVFRYSLDYGAPVSEKLAYRFSYSGEDSEGYYDDEFRKSQSLYGAATWRPNDKYELFLNVYGTYIEYTENFGINRPTQDLIDNHLYRTGINQNNGALPPSDPQNSANVITSSFDFPASILGAPLNPNLFYVAFPDATPSGFSFFAKNNIAYGDSVKINRRTRLLRPGDNSTARNFKVQGIQTVELNPDAKIVNNNLFTYTRRDTKSSYYYSEVVDPAYSFETRTEYQRKLDEHGINIGVAARYLSVDSYSDFGFEPAAAWDITRDTRFINVENSTFPGFGWQDSLGVNRVPVPGHPGRFYGVGSFNSDANESYGVTVGPFAQGDWKLTDSLKLLTGARADFLYAKSELDANATGSGVAVEDSVNVVLPNVNSSLVYKATSKLTTYATYNYSRNTAGAEGNGGGFLLTRTSSTGALLGIDSDSYRTPATLFETGAKYSVLDGKLFFGTSIFDQTYTRKSQGSSAVEYHNTGVEFEVNYQPNRNFYSTFAYTIIDSEAEAASFEASSVNPASPEVVSYGGAGNVRTQGLPKNQFNALASYTFDNGFGLSVNGRLHSEINNNWAGTIVIPWQYELDASLFYTYKRWSARLTVLNFTDEWNWSPPNGVYGLESIKLDPGIRGEFTLAYKF